MIDFHPQSILQVIEGHLLDRYIGMPVILQNIVLQELLFQTGLLLLLWRKNVLFIVIFHVCIGPCWFGHVQRNVPEGFQIDRFGQGHVGYHQRQERPQKLTVVFDVIIGRGQTKGFVVLVPVIALKRFRQGPTPGFSNLVFGTAGNPIVDVGIDFFGIGDQLDGGNPVRQFLLNICDDKSFHGFHQEKQSSIL